MTLDEFISLGYITHRGLETSLFLSFKVEDLYFYYKLSVVNSSDVTCSHTLAINCTLDRHLFNIENLNMNMKRIIKINI